MIHMIKSENLTEFVERAQKESEKAAIFLHNYFCTFMG